MQSTSNKNNLVTHVLFFRIYRFFLVLIFFPTLLLSMWGGTAASDYIAFAYVLAPFTLFIPAFLAAGRKQHGSTSKKDTLLLFLPLIFPIVPVTLYTIGKLLDEFFL